MSNNVETFNEPTTIKVQSGNLLLVDPSLPEKNSLVVRTVKCGDYYIKTRCLNQHYTSSLQIVHADHQSEFDDLVAESIRLQENITIDNAVCGAFDANSYPDDGYRRDVLDFELDQHRVRYVKENAHYTGVFCQSGFGDLPARVYVAKREDLVVYVELEFIDEDEQDESGGDFDAFVERFEPVPNPSGTAPYINDVPYGFETFGQDIVRVETTPLNYVWTIIETERGSIIEAGYHRVNRTAYLITRKPHTFSQTFSYE